MNSTGNIIADTICRTAELGLTITGAADAGEYTVLECVPIAPQNSCPSCASPGVLRDHVMRTLIDLPIVGFPTRLHVRLPRFHCRVLGCKQKYFQAGLSCADSNKKVTHRVTRWILQRLAIDRMSIKSTAEALGLGWDLVCQLALDMCRELVYNDPDHLAGVRIIGVDEHKWSHNRRAHGDGFVTVIVDMTDHNHNPQHPARLLDVVPGRSADALRTWLRQRDEQFRSQIKVISMDGFQGYATASREYIPHARKVMDPFHVVRLVGDKLTTCRQRLQREKYNRRGRKNDPLYKNRKTLLTSQKWLSEQQNKQLEELFNHDDYKVLQRAWQVYQVIINCYNNPDKKEAKTKLRTIITTCRTLPNSTYPELAQLGRSLYKRLGDVLAYFDNGISNGPVEAINGRLEHLRGIALGFRNQTNYILRCLIHSGQLTEKINAL